MPKNDWEKIIEEKIKVAKARGAKKRGWVKFTKQVLTSSINYRMELSEQAIFYKLVVMADECGPVPGLISDNDFRPMPHEYLAHLACCPLELLESTLKKGIEDDSIFENSHGIFLTHFDNYQFTEYDRQRPYRQAKKALSKNFEYKLCPECGFSEKTNEMFCPECEAKGKEVELGQDPDKFIKGKYGNMVKR